MNPYIRPLLIRVAIITCGILTCGVAVTDATVIVTFGSGNSVFSIDRSATFDTLTAYGVADLSTYTEDSLRIQTPTSWLNFPLAPATWYPNAGYNGGSSRSENLDLIATTDGQTMRGVEFRALTGGSTWPDFVWETYRGGNLTGNGLIAASTVIGKVIGWRDVGGIDELRIGHFQTTSNHNVLGMDNVQVELQSAAIPEPSTLATWILFALCGIGWYRRRKA